MNKLVLKLKKEYLWLRILLGVLIFVSFLLVTSKAVDPDLYWHVTLGEQTLKTRHVFSGDAFTYTMPGYPWPDHEWLGEIGISWLYRNNLWLIGILISAIFVFLPFFFWLRRYKRLPEIAIVLLAAALLPSSIAPRPQSFSYLFFFILLEILHFVFVSSQKKKLLLLFLIPMFLIWANLHGGFITGLATLGVFLFGVALDDFLKKKKFSKELKLGLLVFIVCILVTFINPYGARLYHEVVSISFGKNLTKYIAEWTSPLLTDGMILAFFSGTYIVLVVRYFRKYKLPELLVSLALGIFFIKANKAEYFFLVASVPIVISGIESVRAEADLNRFSFPDKERYFGKVFSIVFLMLISGSLILQTYIFFVNFPLKMPEKGADFIAQQIREGTRYKIFNDYNWGGYLTYKIPGLKVFIDGRMPDWREKDGYSAMEEYASVMYVKPSKWREVFAKWKIDEVIINNNEKIKLNKYIAFLEKLHLVSVPSDFKSALKEAGWKTLYEDDTAIVLKAPS